MREAIFAPYRKAFLIIMSVIRNVNQIDFKTCSALSPPSCTLYFELLVGRIGE